MSTATPTKVSSPSFCSLHDFAKGSFLSSALFKRAFKGLKLDFQGMNRTRKVVITSPMRNSGAAIALAIKEEMVKAIAPD